MRKTCKRKRFDPQHHPVRLALMSAPTTADSLASIRTAELMSLAALDAGKATRTDMRCLRNMAAVSATLAADGVGPEALPLAEAATAALSRCGPAADPDARRALADMLGAYDQQRDLATVAQLERAIHRAVWGRVR